MKLAVRFFTKRGKKVFFILISCAGFALFFMDPFLTVLTLVVAGFIFYDYQRAKKTAGKINDLVKFDPHSVKVVSIAGQSKVVRVSCQVNTDLPISLSSPLREVKLSPRELRRGRYTLDLLLSSDISGYYTADSIKARIFGPYYLVRKEKDIFFNLEFKVSPRVIIALAKVALFLLGEGRGEHPVPIKGIGTEYADTREYVPGDTLHYIDWKATARYGKIMVKEFFQEIGQGTHLIYDIRATGPLSQDKLATNFLNTCLGAAEQGYPIGVTIHNGERVLLHSTQENPRDVLKIVMGYILKSMRVDLEDIDRLIEPFAPFQLRSFLNKLKEDSVRKILELEVKILQERLKQPYRFLVQFSRKINDQKQFLLISQLSDDVVELLQFAEDIQSHHQLIIIQPTEPWRETENLEEAYRWYEREKKIIDTLTRHKVQVVKQLISG